MAGLDDELEDAELGAGAEFDVAAEPLLSDRERKLSDGILLCIAILAISTSIASTYYAWDRWQFIYVHGDESNLIPGNLYMTTIPYTLVTPLNMVAAWVQYARGRWRCAPNPRKPRVRRLLRANAAITVALSTQYTIQLAVQISQPLLDTYPPETLKVMVSLSIVNIISWLLQLWNLPPADLVCC